MGFLPELAQNVTSIESTSEESPSKTYRMHIADNRIGDDVDELDAIAQACYKVINTERYAYVIYSWNYGIELKDLFGKPLPYVYAELPRRITEALQQDERVLSVDSFSLSHDRGDVLVRFTVHTNYGYINMEKGVTIR